LEPPHRADRITHSQSDAVTTVRRRGLSRAWRPAGWHREALLVSLVIAAVGAFHVATMVPGLLWGGDSTLYITHAANLVEGRPYAASHFVLNPQYFVAPAAYPPGYPVLLAPVFAVFGYSAFALKVQMVLFLVGILAATALLARRSLSPIGTAAAVALMGFQPMMWLLNYAPLSDLPFALFVLLALWTYERARRSDEGPGARGRGTRWAIATGALVYAAVATRSFGLILPGVFLLADLVAWRRPSRAFLVSTVVVVVLVAAQQVLFDLGAGARSGPVVASTAPDLGYASLLRGLVTGLDEVPANVAESLWVYGRDFMYLWENGVSRLLRNGVALLAVLLAAVGLADRLRSERRPMDVFVVVYSLTLLPWSFQWFRYLVPILPLFFYYGVVGARLVAGRMGRFGRPFLVGIACVLLASYAGAYLRPDFVNLEREMSGRPAREVYAFLRAHAPADATIVGSDARQVGFFTGRSATELHSGPAAEQLRYIDGLAADYLLAGPPSRSAVEAALVEQHPERFEERLSNELFVLYQVRPAGATAARRPPAGI
jgi:hypothetical protein